jgi:hypothetical protein
MGEEHMEIVWPVLHEDHPLCRVLRRKQGEDSPPHWAAWPAQCGACSPRTWAQMLLTPTHLELAEIKRKYKIKETKTG